MSLEKGDRIDGSNVDHHFGLSLSRREREIALRSVRGLTEIEIARDLGISRHTVHTYMGRLYRKLGARNRVELVRILLILRPDVDDA
jgi:DNA-binding CsgD family transcriptional regulator